MINKEENLALCVIVTIFIGIMCLIYFVINKVTNTGNDFSPPIEEIKTIDSIKQSNKTLIIKVEHLDSIKNEKVIKVKELDNDSTVKLFYKLICE